MLINASERVPRLPPSLPSCRREDEGLGTRQNASPDSLLPSLPANEKTKDWGRVRTRPQTPSFPPLPPTERRRAGDASKRVPQPPPSPPSCQRKNGGLGAGQKTAPRLPPS